MNMVLHILFESLWNILLAVCFFFPLCIQVYEEGTREEMIKLEPPSSSRVGDLAHLLSLIPSPAQLSVLSETLSEQESLLMAAQHLRTEEDIQRLLTSETH
jgi:hypothetical protein